MICLCQSLHNARIRSNFIPGQIFITFYYKKEYNFLTVCLRNLQRINIIRSWVALKTIP